MRIDLVCVAKNENLTIKDWVLYHKDKGFHHIWIYDNNDAEDYSLNEILKDEVSDGFVTIDQTFKGCVSFQLLAYNLFLCTHQHKNDYEWVGFIDCDEYVDFTNEKIKKPEDFFNAVENSSDLIGVVYVNWEIYGDNGQYFYEDKPVCERFPTPNPKKIPYWKGDDENEHIKSFIKAGKEVIYNDNPHCVNLREKMAIVTADGMITKITPWIKDYKYTNLKLKHYQTKSLEEYIIRKMGSICADNKNNKPYTLDYYWERNEKTPEALEALKVLSEKYNLNLE